MTPKEKLMEQVISIFQERGQKALELAKQEVLREKIDFVPLREALHYFMEDWKDVLHPALLSLACEAVGGKPDSTTQLGAAIVLLAGGADIHDDIIDQSKTKEAKPTVFGKFGQDLAILAGDALLLKGVYLLHEACEALPKNKKQVILELIKQAFFEISSAEAKEASFRGRIDLSGRDYLDIIRQKVAASETSTRIGAMIGNGTVDEIGILGHFGRTYGILLTIRDEFVDIFEKDEIKNRAERECLPLPILVAFQDNIIKTQILELLQDQISEDKIEKILDLSMDCKETHELIKDIRRMVKLESVKLAPIQYLKDVFELLLESTLEDL